ncbi:hypothetical protein AAV35_000660 [Salimicrobium jeotgali]|uniref:DUF1659 domain-containing protein n=1 Tax=Salimicrobium jeotgali TaxID=1230341 RepID=K2H4C9_9BACI|nr:DUF1659 domain-containing protein [Salimicrobium jeotgali]AKG03435.1 hypothetical protein AAV35_000660 [Salimicrobium jeotgali]EKE30730.1 hypothetical protein MJ3_12210 [Salimicrobium jeotgali]MBM7697141.1 hypothetical protein [Salimicrobium jeotgali]
MAVITTRTGSALNIQFRTGRDVEGKTTYKTKSFRNVRTDATTQSLYEVVLKLKDLQQYSIVKVTRGDEALLKKTEQQ